MDRFVASNGLVLFPQEDGSVWWEAGNDPVVVTSALREFFLHERDVALGRWRWPENPNYVCYSWEITAEVRVLHEATGGVFATNRSSVTGQDDWANAARAYFAAHPEPKPWHDALEGEVWLLMFPNSTQAWFVNGEYFQSVKTLTNIAKTDQGITAGRRIWPEVS